jgi:glucose-6-phosphate dehydrogenase assembly protein OpcA
MTIDLTETSASDIGAALTDLRRHAATPMGVVHTLVIVTDERGHHDAISAAGEAAREHPCRVLAVISRATKGSPRLDSEITLHPDTGPSETITLRLHGPLAHHPASVVIPLLLPDTPVVTWWPGQAPTVPAGHPLGQLAQRRITDAASSSRPLASLAERAEGYRSGDTDLAWTRLTPWRSLLAAALDQQQAEITGGSVHAARTNPSAELLVAWLGDRLGVPIERTNSRGPGVTAVRLALPDGEISVTRPDGRLATLSLPGQPSRRVSLHRRTTADLLVEELRRFNPDEVYAEAVRRFAATADTP